MSLQKPKAVYALIERHYTSACGEAEAPWEGIYEWRKTEQGDWNTDWWSKRSFGWVCRSVVTKVHVAFKHCTLPVFKWLFVPILTYGHEYLVIPERILT